MKDKKLNYKIEYEIILFGLEPFSNVSTKIQKFLDDLTNHNLISHYSWNIVDDKIISHKTLRKIYKYLKKKINYYRK